MVATPSPTESPPPTPPPSLVVTGHLPPVAPRPRRTLLYVGVAIAVALLLLVLFVVVILPSSPSSSATGSGADLTYSQAKPIADSTMSGYKGGGWALLIAGGIDSNTSVTVPLNSSVISSANCTFTPVSSSGTLTIPRTSVSRSAGEAPAWEFVYRNASGTIAVADVISGKGAVMGSLGGECTAVFDFLNVVPSNVVDSSVAAARVAAEPNVSAFLKADPNATAEFGLLGGVSLVGIGAEWSVNYSSCPLTPSGGGFGTVANATVDATSGAVVYYQVKTGVACAASVTTYTIGSSVAFPQLATHAGPPIWYYNFTATIVANSITWANISPEIFTGVTPITTPWTINATTAGGTLIATIDSTTDTWSAGADQAIALGDHFDITSTVDITYDTLQLTGVGQFTGTLDLSLL